MTQAELGNLLARMAVVDVLKQQERAELHLFKNGLLLEQPVRTISVRRDEFNKHAILHNGLFLMRRCVQFRAWAKSSFQFTDEDFVSFKQWLGFPSRSDLLAALKHRLKWTVPIGVLLMIVSIPLPGEPDASLEAVPFDAITFALGLILLLIGGLSRLTPHRVFFALDASGLSALQER